MKRKILVILILCCLLIPFTAHAQEATKRKGIAVLDFKPSGVSASEASFVTEFFRNALVASKAFRLIDKSNMDKVLAEQGFQQSGCTTQECAVQMGKMLNVQGMISGTFGLLFGEYVLTINLVEVETGEITFSDTGRCKDPSQLQLLTNELGLKLAADITGKKPPAKVSAPVTPPAPAAPVAPAYTPPATAAPAYTPPVAGVSGGKIIKVQGNQITINMGKLHGIKKNRVLSVIAVVQEIKSPITGQVIKRKTKGVGKIKITYVESQASIGTLVSLKPGYKVVKGMAVSTAEAHKFKITSDYTFLYVEPPPMPPDDFSPIKNIDFFSDVEFNIQNLRINAGTLYSKRLTSIYGNITYVRAAYSMETFEAGLGLAMRESPGVTGSLRLGSLEKGFSLAGKIYSCRKTPEYIKNGGNDPGNEDDSILFGFIESNLFLSSSFKMYLDCDIQRGVKYYGGNAASAPNFTDSNLGIQFFVYGNDEMRATAIAGCSFTFADFLTTSFGYGFIGYWGIQTLEFDTGGDNWTTADEPHNFNTQLMILGAVIHLTNHFSLGLEYTMERADITAQGGDQLNYFKTSIEFKF